MRYNGTGGGTLEFSTIQGCGAGHGIIIQSNSSPTIEYCTINNNYFYGIIINGSGTGNPHIIDNSLSGNGTHGSTRVYQNIIFMNSSHGVVQQNSMTGSLVGLGCYSQSTPSSSANSGSQDEGANLITGNTYGLRCDGSGSNIGFGGYNGRYFYGTCNSIYGNSSYDAYAVNYGGIYATYDWWGTGSPSPSQFYAEAGSSVNYSNALISPGACPNGYLAVKSPRVYTASSVAAPDISTLIAETSSPDTLSAIGNQALNNEDFAAVKGAFRKVLQNTATAAQKNLALIRLSQAYLSEDSVTRSNDTSVVNTLKSFSNGNFGQQSGYLLAGLCAASGRLEEARDMADSVVARYPGTDADKRALILLASLVGFDPTYADVSTQALNNLKAQFGSTIDSGLVVALTTSYSRAAAESGSANGSSKPGIIDNTTETSGAYGLSNYPNPFNPTTVISYTVPMDGMVTLKVYDVLGREVETLVNQNRKAGRYEVTFDGSRLASGVYFYRLIVGSHTITKKMLMIK